MKKSIFTLAGLLLLSLPSCLKDKEVDYTDWRESNEAYIDEIKALTLPDNSPEYVMVSPVWGPGYKSYIKWHTPRNPEALTPMDNSTVDVVYCLQTIDGTVIDSSYKNTIYGDSIFRTKPVACVPGFHVALTSMAEGDSITAVVPFNSGYGITGSASVKPYSTLIFNLKLKKIVSWEVP